jgi:hypothetical protein
MEQILIHGAARGRGCSGCCFRSGPRWYREAAGKKMTAKFLLEYLAYIYNNPKRRATQNMDKSKKFKKKRFKIFITEFTMPVGREEEFQSRRGWQGVEYNYARPRLLLRWVLQLF